MMARLAAALLSCAAAVALVAVAPAADGQQKAPAARSAASARATAKPAAVDYAQRFAAQCASCHGANGRTDQPLTPVLAGQPSLYAATQLFLFREGRRSNEAMTAVAKTLSDDELRGFSDFIGTLPPVPAPAAAVPADATRMARGRALADQHKCLFCHGSALDGGQQVPRIAGQHEDYLRESLQGFHSGQRPGYTQAMTAAVSQIPVADLDLLAYAIARWPGK